MEVSFSQEIASLQLGAGQEFHGEGILAITKALLQCGVAYVGGYQGAPVSHLLDVMVQAKPLMAELGVHVEPCANEASAAAMLGASLHYPLRGAVTWKSIVGTNVAADALSNLASPGVTGGVLIVVGEDYGEGASVIQERTHAFAMKSSMILFDPRPQLQRMVDLVEHAFAMSEATNMPAMMELRIRACHVRGSFVCKDNLPPPVSTRALMTEPAPFDYMRFAHPPVTFIHEKLKADKRLPAARQYLVEHGLNEWLEEAPSYPELALIVQGGNYNAMMRALQILGLAELDGQSQLPVLVLNVTYPLAPQQILDFAAGRQAVLMLEEGQPEYIEHEIAGIFQRHQDRVAGTRLHGKDLMPAAGELTIEVLVRGLLSLLTRYQDQLAEPIDLGPGRRWVRDLEQRRQDVARALALSQPAAPMPGAAVPSLPPRPPSFCIGCPERPVFAALKLAQQQTGPVHIAADIGCHAFATFEPFSSGHSILGYGMSLASRAGVSPMMQRRSLAIMGDGGFWHNGLLTGVQSAIFNQDDAVLLILKNGYTSATGTQDIVSTPSEQTKQLAVDKRQSLTNTDQTIENTLRGLGVGWMKTVHTYDVQQVRDTLVQALTTETPGLKVIVAEGECQLERQRRIKPWLVDLLRRGQRVVRVKYGVDEDVCHGDHACIRLSGCPTLSLKDNPDPLKVDPVATVLDGCVGCGLCGANAHVATLCPSFYRVDVVQNPGWLERLTARIRAALVGALQWA